MIDIKKDKKSDNFLITQTTNIEGDDYHKQMSLSPDELNDLARWLDEHYVIARAGDKIDDVMFKVHHNWYHNQSKDIYTFFNGILLSDADSVNDYFKKIGNGNHN